MFQNLSSGNSNHIYAAESTHTDLVVYSVAPVNTKKVSRIPEKGLSGLVVFIQRFGSATTLNFHFHVIALDGVYEKKSTGRLKFYPAQAPSTETIQNLVFTFPLRRRASRTGLPLVQTRASPFDA
ncbi:hypothetical protein EBR21_18135 [bacterium]|nr:hypothetical protein [bacterium]